MRLEVKEIATAPNARPTLARSGHMAASPLPPDSPYHGLIIGGYTEEVPSGSPPVRREVAEVWGLARGSLAWQRVECGGDPAPQGRMVGQAVVAGGAVWMLGGWAPSAGPGEAAFLGDVWRLDTRTWAWSRATPQGEPLPRISRFQAAAVGSTVYVHHHRCSDHILAMDVSGAAPVLRRVPVSGDVPPSRGLHTMTALGSSKLVVYGGAPQQGPMMGDLYELDLGSMRWEQVTPSGTVPHARCAHVAAAVPGGRYILYHGGAHYKDQVSGSGGLQVLGDAFLYDAQERAWINLENDHMPAARNAAALLTLGSDGSNVNTFVLHGGWIPFVSTFNDTHKLTVV